LRTAPHERTHKQNLVTRSARAECGDCIASACAEGSRGSHASVEGFAAGDMAAELRNVPPA
jgi:hypothetical protein